MLHFARGLWRRSHGATAIEYGLLAGLLSIALVGALSVMGTALNTTFNSLGTTVSSS